MLTSNFGLALVFGVVGTIPVVLALSSPKLQLLAAISFVVITLTSLVVNTVVDIVHGRIHKKKQLRNAYKK